MVLKKLPYLSFVFCLNVAFSKTATTNPPADVPIENQIKGTLPPMDAADRMAQKILDGISKNDPDSIVDQFFPLAPFLQLKGIADPTTYHQQLIQWYVADIHREHLRLKDQMPLVFKSFKKGTCRWMAPKTEANRIPYWSCYRNQVIATGTKGEVVIPIKAMINWGTNWYVTHLGPIPKS